MVAAQHRWTPEEDRFIRGAREAGFNWAVIAEYLGVSPTAARGHYSSLRPGVRERRSEYRREYYSRPEAREHRREYYSRPEVREWKEQYLREYYSRPEVREHRRGRTREYLRENPSARIRRDEQREAALELARSRATAYGRWQPAEDEAMRRLLREGNDQLSVALLLGRTYQAVSGRLGTLRRKGVDI